MLVDSPSLVVNDGNLGSSFLGGQAVRSRIDDRSSYMAARHSEKSGGLFAACRPPLQVLVGSPKSRTRTLSVVSYEWKAIPNGSFIPISGKLLMSMPEFCFLQMASQTTLANLVLLGYELCGTYAMPKGSVSRRREGTLTTRDRLVAFLEESEGMRGVKRARRAASYVLDGSASPMESILAMMLCLPYGMGGYGLPLPVLNCRIDVPSSVRKLTDKSYYRCDLCWPDARLAVEYDSAFYHFDSERQSGDARRRSALAILGYTIVTVSKGQVIDGGAFNRLAKQLAKLLGKRLRYVDPEFTRRHLELRKELFGSAFAK